MFFASDTFLHSNHRDYSHRGTHNNVRMTVQIFFINGMQGDINCHLKWSLMNNCSTYMMNYMKQL